MVACLEKFLADLRRLSRRFAQIFFVLVTYIQTYSPTVLICEHVRIKICVYQREIKDCRKIANIVVLIDEIKTTKSLRTLSATQIDYWVFTS